MDKVGYKYKYLKYKEKYMNLKNEKAGTETSRDISRQETGYDVTEKKRSSDRRNYYDSDSEIWSSAIESLRDNGRYTMVELGAALDETTEKSDKSDSMAESGFITPEDVEHEEEFMDPDAEISSTKTETPYILRAERGEEDTVDVRNYEAPKEKQSEQIDIGLHSPTRGRVHSESEFSGNDYISIEEGVDRGKILLIKDLDAFDEFTEKYGAIGPIDAKETEEKMIYIKWEDVAKDYMGIKLEESVGEERYTTVIYKGESYPSWWENEYKYRGIIIFEESDYVRYKGKKIKKPFKGRIMNENDFPYDNYIKIANKHEDNKILLLTDTKEFDIFTNRYGELREGGIKIMWRKVKEDYKGVYIDKDSDMKKRMSRAYYKDKKYQSWIKKEGITIGRVYIFE